jgi:hypothetical protein
VDNASRSWNRNNRWRLRRHHTDGFNLLDFYDNGRNSSLGEERL